MTLREFISDTLSQIVRGVADARAENQQVAPPISQRTGGTGYVAHRGGVSHPGVFVVEFDVAVTVSKKVGVDAGGGVSVHIFEGSAKRKSNAEHSTVSRISFQVPVTYDDVA